MNNEINRKMKMQAAKESVAKAQSFDSQGNVAAAWQEYMRAAEVLQTNLNSLNSSINAHNNNNNNNNNNDNGDLYLASLKEEKKRTRETLGKVLDRMEEIKSSNANITVTNNNGSNNSMNKDKEAKDEESSLFDSVVNAFSSFFSSSSNGNGKSSNSNSNSNGSNSINTVRNNSSTASIADRNSNIIANNNNNVIQSEAPKNLQKQPSNSNNGNPPNIPGVDSKMQMMILDNVIEKTNGVSYNDIAGLKVAKQALTEAVIFPTTRPDLFTGLRAPPKGLLLFGPPGNGKTLLAKATAAEAKSTFFNISASSLTSKNYGDSEKLVRALFALARYLQPSVIFIDEIDSILGERSSEEHEASRRLKTELLIQMDGVGTNSDDRVLVMAATNRPQDLDEAVRRRLVYRVYVSLPERITRESILQHLLSKVDHNLSSRDFDALVTATEGMSGSDLTALCKDAAFGPIREIGMERLSNAGKKDIRPVNLGDFKISLQRIRPSVSRESLAQYEEFNRLYGTMQ